jgi:anti-sigma factor RsiW
VDRTRLHDLLEAYLESRLNDADRAELGAALASSRDACRLFWEGVHQHALIGELLAEQRGYEMARREPAVRVGTASRWNVRRWSVGAAVAATAAAVFAAVWLLSGTGDRVPAKPATPISPVAQR